MQIAVLVDEDGLARRDVAQKTKAQAFKRHRLAGHHVFLALVGLGHAYAQRPDAVRIAKSQQAVAGDLRHHRVRAAHPSVQRCHRLVQRGRIERITAGGFLDFVRQHIEQYFRIGIGIDVAPVVLEQFDLQLLAVGQVAVVRQDDAERRIDVERLRLFLAGGAGGRIAHLADAGIAQQRTHVARAKYISHQTIGLVHDEGIAVIGCDTRCILTAMLQQEQSIINQLVSGTMRNNTNDATHGGLLTK